MLPLSRSAVATRGQLRQPATDVGALGIEASRLGVGVEDAQRFGVHAAAGTPLPAAVVGGQIAVHQALHEGPLAPAPVDDQILDQKGGDDHAAAVRASSRWR